MSPTSFAQTATDPIPSDPFGGSQSALSFDLGNGFSDDPFKDLESFDAGQTTSPGFTSSAADKTKGITDDFVSVSDLSKMLPDSMVMKSEGQSSKPKSADPFDAFLDLDPTNEASTFPEPPNGWLDSMERDANRSLSQNDLGSLLQANVSPDGLDTSSQTTGSLLNLSAFGESVSNTLTTKPVSSPEPDKFCSPVSFKLGNSGSESPSISEKKLHEKGQSVNAKGQSVNAKGQFVNAKGQEPSLQGHATDINDDDKTVRFYLISFTPMTIYIYPDYYVFSMQPNLPSGNVDLLALSKKSTCTRQYRPVLVSLSAAFTQSPCFCI